MLLPSHLCPRKKQVRAKKKRAFLGESLFKEDILEESLHNFYLYLTDQHSVMLGMLRKILAGHSPGFSDEGSSGEAAAENGIGQATSNL